MCTFREYLADTYIPVRSMDMRHPEQQVDRTLKAYPMLAAMELGDITKHDVETCRAERMKGGVSKSTLNRELGCLKGMFRLAVERELLPANPTDGIKFFKSDNSHIRFLSDAEEKRLYKTLLLMPEYVQDIVVLALNTGMRRGEIMALRPSQIDLERRFITLKGDGTKSGKTRHIPLNDKSTHVLKRALGRRGRAKRLFPYHDIRTSWARLLDIAEIENFRFHDMRHHAASKMVQNGVPLYTVAQILGHTSMQMTMRYAHLSGDALLSAVSTI